MQRQGRGAVYNENGQLVGYVHCGRDVSTDKWKIFRIMVDKSHQRKGYGESDMRASSRNISLTFEEKLPARPAALS